MRVRWTERASKDTLGIFDYIANQSPTYAESVYERILTRPSQLERFPESGSIVPEYDRPDIRELFRSAWRSLEQQLRQSGNFQAAALMVLNTWNQRQEHHPHLHVIVPGGGPSLDGQSWSNSHAASRARDSLSTSPRCLKFLRHSTHKTASVRTRHSSPIPYQTLAKPSHPLLNSKHDSGSRVESA